MVRGDSLEPKSFRIFLPRPVGLQHSRALMGSTPVALPLHQDLVRVQCTSLRRVPAGALSESSALRGHPRAAASLEQLRKPFGAANSTSLTAVSLSSLPYPGCSMPHILTPSCEGPEGLPSNSAPLTV